MNLWNKFWFQEGSIRPLALFRIWTSIFLFLEYWKRYWAGLTRENFFGNYFAAPYFSWLPQPVYEMYTLLLLGILACTILMAIGFLGRLPFVLFFFLASYHFFLSEFWYSNHLYLMTLVVGILALSPCMKLYSLDNWIARKLKRPWTDAHDRFPLWTQRMIMVQFSLVFIASALSKITLEDWGNGQVLKAIFQGREAKIFPDLLTLPALPDNYWHALALFVILAEVFIGIGLWIRQLRLAAVFLGIVFSAAAELYLNIHLFSYFSLGFLMLFAIGRKT